MYIKGPSNILACYIYCHNGGVEHHIILFLPDYSCTQELGQSKALVQPWSYMGVNVSTIDILKITSFIISMIHFNNK
jgi:hypothetical protein